MTDDGRQETLRRYVTEVQRGSEAPREIQVKHVSDYPQTLPYERHGRNRCPSP